MLDSSAPEALAPTPIAVRLLGWLPLAYVLIAMNLVMLPRFATWHDQQRIFQIGLLAAIAIVLAVSSDARRAWLEAFTSMPLAGRALVGGFFLLGTVSVARAEILRPAMREWALFLLLAVLAVAVAAARRHTGSRFDASALTVLVVATILYLLVFAGLRLAGFDPYQFRVGTYGAMYGFSNPRFFGQAAIWILPLLIAAPTVLDDGRRLTRILLFTVAIGWCALLIESGGRGTFLAMPVALIATLVALRRPAFRWARHAAGVVLGGIGLWFGLNRISAQLAGVDAALPPPVTRAMGRGVIDRTFRPIYWGEAGDMTLARPFFGVGPEHFAFHRVESPAAHPHSAPLQLSAEWGIIATVLLLSAIAWALLAWIRRTRQVDPSATAPLALRTGLLASAVGAGFYSLIDGVIVMPVSQVLLVLVAGWMIGAHTYGEDSAARARTRIQPGTTWTLRESAVPVVAVAALVAVLWGAGTYLLHPRSELNRRIEVVVERGGDLFPRFWIEGILPEP